MKQPISGYHKDEHDDWVAELECGHYQHVRHNPPWALRPWVTTKKGRDSRIGHSLKCKKCNHDEPKDFEI